ncbi:TatD DNase domain containing 3 [Diplonema papillatum]|nr:TatD DNase domain containing 3 [Diplonema papillatum]
MGPLVDCHAHLTDTVLKGKIQGVIERALLAGVGTIVVVAEDADDSKAVLDLVAEYPSILRACVGLHPERVPSDPREAEEETDRVIKLICENSDRIVGVGEVGLDYTSHVKASRETQVRAFSRQIEVAVALDLALNVHSRQAGHYAIECLQTNHASKAVLHAFDGRAAYAREAAARCNFRFSIAPSTKLGSKLLTLPLESLLLETDAPALAPEPAALVESIKLIQSAHKGLSCDSIGEATTRSAESLFGPTLRKSSGYTPAPSGS